jgi:hypothetical protein
LLLQCVKADLDHAPCAAASAAKTAADQLPSPAAPALPSPAPQAAQAVKDAVPDLSAIFRDAINGGEMRLTCKGSVTGLEQGALSVKRSYSIFACLRAGKSAKTEAAGRVPTPAAPAPPQEASQAAKALKDAVPAPAQAKEAAKDGKAWVPAWLHQLLPC